jgi:hypothetical protein
MMTTDMEKTITLILDDMAAQMARVTAQEMANGDLAAVKVSLDGSEIVLSLIRPDELLLPSERRKP